MNRMQWPLTLLCLALVSTATAAPRTYRIGNSLTWDSQPKGIEALAAQRELEHVEAYHINCGKSLERIWTHPEEICVSVVEPFGTFGKALPNHDWDAVTFQPHPGAGSTLATDADVRVIPAGQVVYELDRRMRAGEIAGYASAADLYRDPVHMNNVGRFAAGVTTFATLYKQDPAGLKCPPKHYGGGNDFTPKLYATIHEAIWTVVTEMHAVTGVSP